MDIDILRLFDDLGYQEIKEKFVKSPDNSESISLI